MSRVGLLFPTHTYIHAQSDILLTFPLAPLAPTFLSEQLNWIELTELIGFAIPLAARHQPYWVGRRASFALFSCIIITSSEICNFAENQWRHWLSAKLQISELVIIIQENKGNEPRAITHRSCPFWCPFWIIWPSICIIFFHFPDGRPFTFTFTWTFTFTFAFTFALTLTLSFKSTVCPRILYFDKPSWVNN